jgi:hypothetical protein
VAHPTLHPSPQFYARLAGVLYLINILCGFFGEIIVRARLVVPQDPAATAHNILAHQLLFRCGIAGDLIMHLTDVPLIVIFYVLLRPVSRDLSLLAAFLNLVQTSMLVANKVTLSSALALLTQTPGALSTPQLQQMALNTLTLHEDGFGIGLVFFGVTCLLTGYLIFQSGYIPRTIGIFQAIAGLCYLINSFAFILSPALAAKLAPIVLPAAGLCELGTCLWFLLKGINTGKWNERLRLGPVIHPITND